MMSAYHDIERNREPEREPQGQNLDMSQVESLDRGRESRNPNSAGQPAGQSSPASRRHVIKEVGKGSIAKKMGLEPGDALFAINGQAIEDIFDYQYLTEEEEIDVSVEKRNGGQITLHIEKDADEDLGVTFENGMMDEYRRCQNSCVFCFIDQLPKGLRPSLYFKDDDSRLSFLQGNYVTLTNMSDHDIDRIIQYRLSPINISFHTMDPALRCRMLGNRFAGDVREKVDRLFAAGIGMNGQIVLCKGLNDGKALDQTIEALSAYQPHLASVSIVPVGLTKYREGLYPLEPFTKEDACRLLEQLEPYRAKFYASYGNHFVHASDEWYLMAGWPLPDEAAYDGYLQLENGVGMMTLFRTEFDEALKAWKQRHGRALAPFRRKRHYSIATGMLAYPEISRMADDMMRACAGLSLSVYPIRNDFFGELITVSGLLTARDIISQLRGRDLGRRLLLPSNLLRSEGDIFLDGQSVADVSRALQVKVDIVKSSGYELVSHVLGE